MNDTERLVAVLGIVAIAGLFVYATNQGDGPVPIASVQTEGQVMGLGVQGDVSLVGGTMLDPDPAIHFYSPGYDPVQGAQPMVEPKHRYPAIPGGNVSTVMHKGWSAFMKDAPADNDWRINPPEVSVL